MSMSNILTKQLSTSQKVTYERYKSNIINVGKAIWKQPTAKIGLFVLMFFTVVAVLGPNLAPYDPQAYHTGKNGLPLALEPPSTEHLMGTTHQGQDVFSQWLIGARVSILVGFLAGASVAIIGTTVGLISGYYKGIVDLVLMRIVDIMYGVPATPLILILALFFGPSLWNIILAFVIILWRSEARIIRAQTLSLSERPFVKSARAAGASDFRIMFQHILPNLLPIILIETTIIIGAGIMLEAGLSFLGMGAQGTSWGTMLQMTFVTGAIRDAWWWVLPPGISITILVMSFYYVSRALEEITNPELGGGLQ